MQVKIEQFPYLQWEKASCFQKEETSIQCKIASIQWKWYIGWLCFMLLFLMKCCSVLNTLGWLLSDLVRSE